MGDQPLVGRIDRRLDARGAGTIGNIQHRRNELAIECPRLITLGWTLHEIPRLPRGIGNATDGYVIHRPASQMVLPVALRTGTGSAANRRREWFNRTNSTLGSARKRLDTVNKAGILDS